MNYLLSFLAMFSISCADNLNYEYLKAAAACVGPDCASDDPNASEGNYTEDMQWGRSHYQTLSLKHVAVKSDYIYGRVMIGANDIDFTVEQAKSSNPEYTVLYSGQNFDKALRYGTFEASLKLILDDEEYYTDQTMTLKDFDHFSAYNVASFKIEREK